MTDFKGSKYLWPVAKMSSIQNVAHLDLGRILQHLLKVAQPVIPHNLVDNDLAYIGTQLSSFQDRRSELPQAQGCSSRKFGGKLAEMKQPFLVGRMKQLI